MKYEAEVDALTNWKIMRVVLAERMPGMKPSDFDTMGDAPSFPAGIDVRRYEISDMIAVLNGRKKAKS